MQEIGTIKSLHGDMALVQINRGDKCEGCNVCHAFGDNKMQVEARNGIHAEVGDTVQVDIEPGDVLRGSLLVFVFPLAMMVLGYIVGMRFAVGDGEGAGILGALIALAVAFFIIKLIDRNTQEHVKDTAIVTTVVQHKTQ